MADHEAETPSPFLSAITYDTIRNVQQRVLPAIGVFYAAIALIWGLPWSVQVVGTLSAIGVLLGVLMSLSKKSFQNAGGDGTVDQETGVVAFNDPSVLDKDTIVLTKGSVSS